MKQIAVIFGTRPEAIKMAPVIQQLEQSGWCKVRVIVSGQHKEMLTQVLTLFNIKACDDLQVMSNGQSLSKITAKVLNGLDRIFGEWRPDFALVHGDTATAFGAALACFYQGIPLGHVEAGLRSGCLADPFPEEANRRLIDTLTHVFFAPTKAAADNLLREGVAQNRVHVTGNTGIDALYQVIDKSYSFRLETLRSLDFSRQQILITVHRRENWGDSLRQICEAVEEISQTQPVEFVFAMHKNPVIRSVVQDKLGTLPKIRLIDAPEYREFANLLDRCHLVLTDSGGLQEEAMALNKPVLVLRDNTERPEGVAAGGAKVIGRKKEDIVKEVTNMITDGQLYDKMARSVNPYGDGKASYRIQNILKTQLQ